MKRLEIYPCRFSTIPAQKGHGSVGMSSEEGLIRVDQRDGSPLLWGKARRIGIAWRRKGFGVT